MANKTQTTNALLYVFTIGILVVLFTSIVLSSQEEKEPQTIALTSEAEKELQPDMYRLSVGVSQTGENLSQIEASVTQKMSAITQSLKEMGYNESELQTQQFRVSEDYYSNREENSPQRYRVTQELQIESKKTQKVSETIQEALNNGANSINSLTFDVTDEKKASVKNSLLKEAYSSSYEQAEVLADSSNSKIIGVQNIQVENTRYVPYRTSYASQDTMEGSAGSSISIEEGDVSVSSSIRVVYEIK